MTLREIGSGSSQWFSEWWCKLVLMETDGCKEKYLMNWNWLDFTIGQALFTIFVAFLVLSIFPFVSVWQEMSDKR